MELLANLSQILSGLALLGFVGVTLWLMLRPRERMAVLLPAPRWLAATAAMIALWCAAIYIFGPGSTQDLLARTARNLAILGWLGGSFWNLRTPMSRPLRLIMRLLATCCLIVFLFGCVAYLHVGALSFEQMEPGLAIVAMITASGGLLLTDSAVRHADTGVRMPLLAVAGAVAMLWAYELNIQLIGVLTAKPASTLILLLPAVALLMLPTFVIAAMDVGRERMRLSRTAATRAILLIGGASYLILISLAGAAARLFGGDYGDLAQGMFLIMALGAGGLLFVSQRARAWLSVTISKHFFEYRYDYRAEWMRFTATLSRASEGEGEGGLYRRVAKALAELTASPGALLMLPDPQGIYRLADGWRWESGVEPGANLPLRTAFMLQETAHIVDLDVLRRGPTTVADQGDLAIPDWLLADTRAWVVVPLLHSQRMIAVVILHRPPASRSLDWEDLDVLRIAGRQAASNLAESQSQQALSEAKRFDEFNRRFAFIMHDIKNLASQLSLLARNAERHADKPEFRADMVGTLKISAGRLSDLLARLSPRERPRALQTGQLLVEPLLTQVAAQVRSRRLMSIDCTACLAAWADRASVHQIVEHLVTNAIDASPDGMPVQIFAAREAQRVRIDIIDQGCGMSREFIRDELFKPFVSTKEGGFGLGAFEALQLAQAMGGKIDVSSELGQGSRFTLWLPAADELGAAAAGEWMKVAT